MKLAVFSTKSYDRVYLNSSTATEIDSAAGIEITHFDFPPSLDTVGVIRGAQAICVFVNDVLDAKLLEAFAEHGVKVVLLRCAGFNNIDLEAAERLGLFVANVPAYSPASVAEFALALLQTLNRKTHRAYNRVRDGNFDLDGLMGTTMAGKTVGIVGTGKIGVSFAKIMWGIGCKLLAYDPYQSDEMKKYGQYTELDTLLSQSDIVSLHCPLMDSTKHIINETSLAKMKTGALLVNTSRGGLVNTKAVIDALKRNQLGGLAMDVYEGEGALFYNDHSSEVITDDDLMRLVTFPNVIVTGHQAFLTEEAVSEIAACTIRNLSDFLHRRPCPNSLLKKDDNASRRMSVPVRI